MKIKELYYFGEGENEKRLLVNIRYNDECRNGYSNFAMTGSHNGSCGCIHDTILSFIPEFKIFADLHLCNGDGQPMHFLANGTFHIKEGKWDSVQRHFRLTDAELESLQNNPQYHYTEKLLAVWLEDNRIPARWALEAYNGKQFLVALKEDPFASYTPNTRKKVDYTWLDLTETREKIANGEYSPENIEKMKEADHRAKWDKKIEAAKKEYKKTIAKHRKRHNITMLLLEHEIDDNVIFYDHSNELCFNWHDPQYATYQKKWTNEEVEKIKAKLKNEPVLKGIEIIKKYDYDKN